MSISLDTIYIELSYQDYQSKTISLKNNSDTIDSETGEIKFSVGYHDGIKVRKFKSKVRIECSLPRLLKGHNIYSLNYEEVMKALKLMEKKLGISLRNGIIRRLDIFLNVETEHEAENYFRYLASCKYLTTRIIVGKTSLYFKNESREINFYDKIAKILSDKQQVPFEYLGKNITRIENRYKNSFLVKKFGKNFTVENLFDPHYFLLLINLFMTDYDLIYKENKAIADFTKITSKKELLVQLSNKGIEALGGVTEVLELIEASRYYNKNIRDEYFSRRKKEVRDIAQSKDFTMKMNLVEELNLKVQHSFMQSRNYLKINNYEK